MAIDIITKEKKNIMWRGLPTNTEQEGPGLGLGLADDDDEGYGYGRRDQSVPPPLP